MDNQQIHSSTEGIAIIGMVGRFPGAKNIDEFWQNLCNGQESISFFSNEELEVSGIDPAWLQDPSYVKAGACLSDIEMFDAPFFDCLPREAELMDPQHRLLLECAWEALETAGYAPGLNKGLTGVYLGTNLSVYMLSQLSSHADFMKSMDLSVALGNDQHYLATKVSYKLNLTGPSVNISTACSTSLVAVHLACQGLLNYECSLALAGGVSIQSSKKQGYFYEEGGIFSPDGHCRAFDAKAQGTIFGDGIGIVVLKRLEDALTDGDCIHAVIQGSAINNDGAAKVGYTAPSVKGQTKVIVEAQAIAGFAPETITYIETHGTGTALGDPIEISALKKTFEARTRKKGFCAIGSVKPNVGHLNVASGVTSLIKTVMALKHKIVPPSLHYEQPNPEIDFANSPFYVNTKLSEWKTNGTPCRAGVSSFGIGGTNAHVILEEAPVIEPSSASRPWQLLVLSTKTSTALETVTVALANHLQQHPNLNLADVAQTLQVGRRTFDHRRMLVCRDLDDVVKVLTSQDPQRIFTHHRKSSHCQVIFMFSGQGAQYVNMAKQLYEVEPTFREPVDTCAQILQSLIDLDVRQILFPQEQQIETASQQLQQTEVAQPALFVIEYALAQLWQEWGVHPEAMIGHSIGEYVAATMAGVFSLEDALVVVATRAKLMQQLPAGSMLAIPLPEEQVQSWLEQLGQKGISCQLAAINSPSACVVSGSTEAIAALQQQLSAQGIACRLLHTSHAFHSEMMEPILAPFVEVVKKIKLNPPRLRFISNVTGDWITTEQATSPSYWGQHLRQAVRFSAGISHLLEEFSGVFLEVGPGRTLSTLTTQHLQSQAQQQVLSSLHHAKETQSDVRFLLQTLGRLWLAGVEIDWSGFYAHEQRHRLPLPTYPFERQRYWIEPPQPVTNEYQTLQTTPDLWKSLVDAGHIQANAGTSEFDEQIYLEKLPSLEALCLAYMNIALRQLGAFENSTQQYSIEAIFEQCQIIPRYRQLLSRWLHVLVEHNQLQQNGKLFNNLAPCSTNSINALLKDARLTWTDNFIEQDLIQRCGENLASVLVGEQEPLEFFQDVIYDFDETEDINKQSPLNTYYNRILQAIMKQVVDSLPSLTNLRILEIGGGQGLATREVLPVLPFQQTSYTFTDVGSSFLNSGQRKFSAYPFIDYRFLNIEQPPTEQGYEDHSFDVVIAVNVLHVTTNMAETLQHVRSLLAPNGLLLLWETTQETLYFDITWGLLMNPLEDEERSRGNPFLSKEQWQEALCHHGFVEVIAFPETEAFAQHIIVAQASSSAALSIPAAFTTTLRQKAFDRTLQAPSTLSKKPDISDWFYVPSWKRFMPPQPFQSEVAVTQSGCWLVFVDECGLGIQIAKRLEAEGHDVVIVRAGEQFSSELRSPNSQGKLTINPQQRSDYDTLLEELIALNLRPSKIVHLWSVTLHSYSISELQDIDQVQEKGFYSLMFLTQALEHQNLTHELQITVISNNLQSVTGEERLSPAKATLLGLIKVIPLEYPNIRCCSIDVLLAETDSWQEEKLLESLLTELSADISDEVIAYRGAHRWVRALEPIRLDEAFDGTPRLKQGGVYLITGGLGAIGLEIASYLAKTVRAKLVLTGRSAFPAKADWEEWLTSHDRDDDINCKINKLKELEQLGAEVLVVRADVADLEQMQQVITQSQEWFGPINGVVHSAGIPGGGVISLKTCEDVESVFASKVKGALVLDTVLKDIELDFIIFCSSLSSFNSLFGQTDYSSANQFLDAFAHYKNSNSKTFTVSINWSAWQGSRMAVDAAEQFARGSSVLQTGPKELSLCGDPSVTINSFQADFLKSGLSPSEGIEAFRRILGSTLPQVVVSPTDLDLLVRINSRNAGQPLSPLETLGQGNLHISTQPRHSRPELSNAYIAPRNELEKMLTNIWQEVLGIKQIGIHDNFFELGGDSLMAIQVISQVRKTFGTEFSVRKMLEIPTVAGLSDQIENTRLTTQSQQVSVAATVDEREEEVF